MSRKASMTHRWYFAKRTDDPDVRWRGILLCAKCGRGCGVSTVLLQGECVSRINDIDWDRPFDVEHYKQLKAAR